MESVGSMSEEDRTSMSRSLGILPYALDAAGITPSRRQRLYWFDWPITSEHQVEIQRPLAAGATDFGRISFLQSSPPDGLLEPGWSLAGGCDHIHNFPAEGSPAGLEGCSARDLAYWEADRFKFPPYQYKFEHGLTHPKKGWRLPTVNEREVMLGFPLDYTLHCWPKSERRANPQGWEDCRLTLFGNSCSIPVAAFL